MTTSASELMHRGVACELGIEIIDGDWAVGASRTLEEIQSRFGVSRTVAREASRQLESMGLAHTRRRLGLVAQPMTQWNVLDPTLIGWRLRSRHRDDQIYTLTQLRLAVEPAAAASAASFAPSARAPSCFPWLRRCGARVKRGRLKSSCGWTSSFTDCCWSLVETRCSLPSVSMLRLSWRAAPRWG